MTKKFLEKIAILRSNIYILFLVAKNCKKMHFKIVSMPEQNGKFLVKRSPGANFLRT